MRNLAILVISPMLCLNAAGQNFNIEGNDFDDLIKARDWRPISGFMDGWLRERISKRDQVGNSEQLKPLYDKEHPEAYSIETRVLADAIRFCDDTLLRFKPNSQERRDYVELLQYVERSDDAISSRSVEEEELKQWVSRRVAFAVDTKAKFERGRQDHFLECDVEAKTINQKSGKEEGDYRVMYLLSVYKDEPNRANRFDAFSSPTTEGISAGYYIFWATDKDEKRAGKKEIIEIHNKQHTIELDAPPPGN